MRDDGSVTAELAIGMTAVTIVLGFGVGLVQIGQARLQVGSAAASAARLLARDEEPSTVAAMIRATRPETRYSVRRAQEGGLSVTTVTVWRELPVVGVGGVTVRASATAVTEGPG